MRVGCRLRKWEARERRKHGEHAAEKERERCRDEEREREAKRLKEFLEDYDDERDDHKYYKGKVPITSPLPAEQPRTMFASSVLLHVCRSWRGGSGRACARRSRTRASASESSAT